MITQREIDMMQIEAEQKAEELFQEFLKAFMGNRAQPQEIEENGQRNLYGQTG